MPGQRVDTDVAKALLGLVACTLMTACESTPPSCLEPRASDATQCTSLRDEAIELDRQRPLGELEAHCEASCIDAWIVTVKGYASLADVPLLGKLRRVDVLKIDVDPITDLRGLENIESLQQLSLEGTELFYGRQPPAKFSSLQGLKLREINTLRFKDTFAALTGSELQQIGRLGLSNVADMELDVGPLNPRALELDGADRLATVRLGSGPMTDVVVDANPALAALEWDAALRVTGSVSITRNRAFSNCLAIEFANATRGSRDAGADNFYGNGPCP